MASLRLSVRRVAGFTLAALAFAVAAGRAGDAASALDDAANRAEMRQDEVPVGGIVNDGPPPAGGVSVFGDDVAEALRAGTPKLAKSVAGRANGGFSLSAPARRAVFAAPSAVDVAHGDIVLWDITVRGVKKAPKRDAITGRIVADGLFWPIWLKLNPGEEQRHVSHSPAWEARRAGKTSLSIELADAGSEIEVVSCRVLNYRKDRAEGSLPYRRADYQGRAADAPWRAAALRRIEEIRTVPFRVRVTDTAGRPRAGVEVAVDMTRSAFAWGGVSGGNLLDQSNESPDAVRFRAELLRLCNASAMENLHKWRSWDQPRDRARAIRWNDWMVGHGLKVRGHVMVWPSWKKSPPRLKTEYDAVKKDRGDDAAKMWLRQAILDHIADIGSTLRGQVADWDVINETAANRDFWQILGEAEMAEWFRAAHRADPGARLFIAENSLLVGTKLDHFLRHAKMIRDAGAPIGGLGAQGHIGIVEPEKILASLDRLAELGLPVSITEFDVRSIDKDLQAEMLRDALTAFYSHPAVDGVYMWGFWDGRHWLTDAPLYFRDWTPKPALAEYERLVLGAWRTRARGATDADGVFAGRAHRGAHSVAVGGAGGRVLAVDLSAGAPEDIVVSWPAP